MSETPSKQERRLDKAEALLGKIDELSAALQDPPTPPSREAEIAARLKALLDAADDVQATAGLAEAINPLLQFDVPAAREELRGLLAQLQQARQERDDWKHNEREGLNAIAKEYDLRCQAEAALQQARQERDDLKSALTQVHILVSGEVAAALKGTNGAL